MHLVDTSVWIEFLRPAGSPEIQSQLKPLIQGGNIALTEWIILELMTGLRSNQQASTLLDQLAPVHRLSLPQDGWAKAWDLAACLRKKGITTSAADCLITTVTTTHAATLIHCDSDFERIAGQAGMKTIDWTSLLKA